MNTNPSEINSKIVTNIRPMSRILSVKGFNVTELEYEKVLVPPHKKTLKNVFFFILSLVPGTYFFFFFVVEKIYNKYAPNVLEMNLMFQYDVRIMFIILYCQVARFYC